MPNQFINFRVLLFFFIKLQLLDLSLSLRYNWLMPSFEVKLCFILQNYDKKIVSTIFTKIVNGQIPCYKIVEDKHFMAFLDVRPLAAGHTLVIPKKELDYIMDLDDELYTGLFLFAKRVAKAIDRSILCQRVGMAVIGLEVPHAHIHLVPLNTLSDITFTNPRLSFTKDEFENIASRIADVLNAGEEDFF